MSSKFVRFVADKSGATAFEYGLIRALIALAIPAALNTTGEALVAKLASLAEALI